MDFGLTVLPDPPYSRLLELLQLGEASGFTHGWTYDSHVLWQEPFPLLTMAAERTTTLKLGLCVTNPGTRDPTVLASAHALLQDISGGRIVMGIGRGDSARRVIGQKPVLVVEFERRCAMIKDFMNGRTVTWNERELTLEWAKGRAEIPMYVAGYGPKVLAIAGRVVGRRDHPAGRPGHRRLDDGHRPQGGRGGRSRPVGAGADRVRAVRAVRRPRRRPRARALVPGDGLEPCRRPAAALPQGGAAAGARGVRRAQGLLRLHRALAGRAPSTASSSTTRRATASASSARPSSTSRS